MIDRSNALIYAAAMLGLAAGARCQQQDTALHELARTAQAATKIAPAVNDGMSPRSVKAVQGILLDAQGCMSTASVELTRAKQRGPADRTSTIRIACNSTAYQYNVEAVRDYPELTALVIDLAAAALSFSVEVGSVGSRGLSPDDLRFVNQAIATLGSQLVDLAVSDDAARARE